MPGSAAVHDVLAPYGWQIQTAFVERINLTIRQHVAAVGRRVSTLCKDEDGLRQQLALYHGYYCDFNHKVAQTVMISSSWKIPHSNGFSGSPRGFG